jgi:hypothetical protein
MKSSANSGLRKMGALAAVRDVMKNVLVSWGASVILGRG